MRCGASFNRNRLLFFLGENIQLRNNLFNESRQIHIFPGEQRIPRFGPREQQQAIDKPGEAVDFLQHASDNFAILGFATFLAQSHFADTANGRERCAQFVRRIGGKPPHLVKGRLKPGQRVVEHGREPTEFVVRIVHRKPVTHASRGNQACLLGHSIHGGQRTSGEYVATETGKQDTERKTEKKKVKKIAQVLLNRRHRPRHLNDEFTVAEHGFHRS